MIRNWKQPSLVIFNNGYHFVESKYKNLKHSIILKDPNINSRLTNDLSD